MSKSAFTPVGKLGRSSVIDHIADKINKAGLPNGALLMGPGDDACVLTLSDDTLFMMTSETYCEGVDFDLSYMPVQHLGYKLLTAAIGDILAMNGLPEYVMINLALPNKFSQELVDLLYDGFIKGAQVHRCAIVGGDLTASASGLVVSITITGKANAAAVVYRSGAQAHDAICVTGDLGAAYAGLRILLREKHVWGEDDSESDFAPDLTDYEYVIKRQLAPESRMEFIESLAACNIKPSSMTDISRNLLNELKSILKSSDTGAMIYQAALPIALETRAVADELGEDVDQYALQGGEDFELLFTLPEKDVNKLVHHFKDFVVIGKITDAGSGLQMQTGSGEILYFDSH